MTLKDLLIIHITDLHLEEDITDSENKAFSIAGIINNSHVHNVLFFITGDISNSGEEKQYESFIRFYEGLKDKIHDDIRIFTAVVPGNHDRSFAKEEKYSQTEALSVNSKNYMDKFDKQKFRFENYFSFEEEFLEKNVLKHNDCLLEQRLVVDDHEISVFMLNNVSFVTYKDQEKSVRGENKESGNTIIPRDFLKPIKESKSSYLILGMHMPYSYLDFETSNYLSEALSSKRHVLLTGHIHEEHFKTDRTSDGLIQELVGARFDNQSSLHVIDFFEKTVNRFVYKKPAYTINDSVRIEFNVKKNLLGLSIKDEFLDTITKLTVYKTNFVDEDVFVFPYLAKDKEYKNSSNDIKGMNGFRKFFESKGIAFIEGDDGLGKTTLAKQAFKESFFSGFLPVYIDCDDIQNKKKIVKYIRSALLEEYFEENSFDIFEQSSDETKILILDNFDGGRDCLEQFAEHFEKIIVFGRPKSISSFNALKDLSTLKITRYEITPFYVDKRKELIGRVCDVLNRKSQEGTTLRKEDFVNAVEEWLSKIDKVNSIDPGTIIYLTTQVFSNTSNLNSAVYDSVFQAKVDLLIKDYITANSLSTDLMVIKRVIGRVALNVFRKKEMTFDKDDIDYAMKVEEDFMGNNSPKLKRFVDLLKECHIAYETEELLYRFVNRDVFAFFVAFCCGKRLYEEENNNLSINEILETDIFVPLNFLILMSVATQKDIEAIPASIVSFMEIKCSEETTVSENELLQFSINMKDVERLQSLNSNDLARIDRKRARLENKNRKDYLQNKDDFYYFEKVTPEIRNLAEWINRLNVCSVLFSKYSSSLTKTEKDRLAICLVKLPLIVQTKAHKSLFKMMDELYASIINEQKDRVTSEEIESLRELLFDWKRAFILMAFGEVAKSCHTSTSFELIQNAVGKIYENGSDLSLIFKNMLDSYSLNRGKFQKESLKLLSMKENNFIKTSSFIIARNYTIRNYSYVVNEQRPLFEAIVKEQPSLLKNKIK